MSTAAAVTSWTTIGRASVGDCCAQASSSGTAPQLASTETELTAAAVVVRVRRPGVAGENRYRSVRARPPWQLAWKPSRPVVVVPDTVMPAAIGVASAQANP